MRCIGYVFLILLNITSIPLAQTPDTLWTSSFGGSENEYCYDGIQTSDGGYMMIGYTMSPNDLWLVKATSTGVLDWSSTFSVGDESYGYSVIETSDGGFLLGGYTYTFGGGQMDALLIKTDSNGSLVWEKTYGGNGNEIAQSVIQTSDGGYAFTGDIRVFGSSTEDVWLVKTDSNGILVWDEIYGDSISSEHSYQLIQTSDDGYVIAGLINGNGLIIKTNPSGSIEWDETYGGHGGDTFYAIEETLDGGYISVGSSEYLGAGDDVWIVKTDSTGAVEWDETYGGTGQDWGTSITALSDTTYVISGTTTSWGAVYGDVLLFKIDSVGSTIWELIVGGPSIDRGEKAVLCSDNGYAIFGYRSIEVNRDFYLIKTTPDLTGIEEGSTADTEGIQLFVLPNPFGIQLEITYDLQDASEVNISIYDLTGRLVETLVNSSVTTGEHSVVFDGTGMVSGVYLVRLVSGSQAATARAVLMR